MDGGAWWATVHGVAKSWTRLSDFTFTFHFHALEKEMATHSSVLAWGIPGTGESGGLPSRGSHRVGHDWSNLAAAAMSCFGNLCPPHSNEDILLYLLRILTVYLSHLDVKSTWNWFLYMMWGTDQHLFFPLWIGPNDPRTGSRVWARFQGILEEFLSISVPLFPHFRNWHYLLHIGFLRVSELLHGHCCKWCLAHVVVAVVQLLSCVQLFAAHQASLSFTVSQSLLKFMSIGWWCYLTVLASSVPISFCLQSSPASESFPMTWLFVSGGQSTGGSALALPMNIQSWFPLGSSDLISLLSKGLSQVFSSTTI